MSDQEQAMRLIAEVVDRYSGPLKEMQRVLKATANATKDMHIAGRKQAQEHAKAYHELKESIGKVKENVSGVLSPALVGLGITALSVESAVTGIISAVRDLGTSSRQLALISKETGFTISDLRVLENMWMRQGQAVATTDAAMLKFSETQAKFAKGNHEVWQSFGNMGPKVLEFEKSIQGLPRMEQVSRTIAFRRTITEQYQKDRFDALTGFNDTMDNGATPERFKAAQADNARNPGDNAKGIKTADTMDELLIAIEHVKEKFGEAFAGPVLEAVNGINRFLDNKEAVDHFARTLSGAFELPMQVLRGYTNLQTILNFEPGKKRTGPSRRLWTTHSPRTAGPEKSTSGSENSWVRTSRTRRRSRK
jgi:hypothetical protein